MTGNNGQGSFANAMSENGTAGRYVPAAPFLGQQTDNRFDVVGDIVALAGGGFVILRAGGDGGSSITNLYAQIFDTDGNLIGTDIVILPDQEIRDGGYRAAARSDGGFVIVTGGPDGSSEPFTQVINFDASGNQLGDIQMVAVGQGGIGEVAALTGGGYVVTWSTFEFVDGGPEFVIGAQAQFFGADGQPTGIPVTLDFDPPLTSFGFDEVAGTPDGGFVMTWAHTEGQGADRVREVRGQFFNADGDSVGDLFVVPVSSTDSDTYPSAAVLLDGTLVVAHIAFADQGSTELTLLNFQLVSPSGELIGDPATVSNDVRRLEYDVAATSDGGFVITWDEPDPRESSPSDTIIRAQFFNSDGTAVDDAFTIFDFDGDVHEANPFVATLASGDVVFAFRNEFRDPDSGFSTSDAYGIIFASQISDVPTEGNDVINGTDGDDVIDALAGNDVIRALEGNDVVNGGDGDDLLFGGGGDDTLDGGAGDDTIFGGAGNDVITTGVGNDVVDAGSGDDVVMAQISDIARFDPSLRVVLNADGGSGEDSFVFTPGELLFAVYDATNVSGFETLVVDSTNGFTQPILIDFNGLREIEIIGGQGGVEFTDSDNRNADVTFSTPVGSNSGGGIGLTNSSVASVTGSDGVDSVIVRNGSFAGDVSLGGSNDRFVIEAGSSLGTAITSLDGGAGDEDQLIYNFPEAPIDDSLANVTGFEQLLLTWSNVSELQSYSFSAVSGFDLILAVSSIFGPTVDAANINLLPGSGSDLSGTVLGGANGGSYTIGGGLTVHSYTHYGIADERPEDNPERFAALGATILNQGTIINEVDFDNGDDLYDGRNGTVGGPVTGGAGNDTLLGGTGSESFFGGLNADILNGGEGNDALDGGSNVDIAVFSGDRADYTITQTQQGVFEVVGPDGTDTLTTIEFAQFDDETVRLLIGDGTSVNFETANPSVYADAVTALRDFDGNDLGGDGSWLRIGSADVNGDGDIDQILVNDAIGRFATVGTAVDGLVYFGDHGWAGETRVAGIYLDPFVANGSVEQGSPFDSQARFQNDLRIENINRVLGANDYNNDGVWEVYLALTDGTAYLQALMHADGNIRFANYQNEQQVRNYLEANGFGEETFGDWFPNDQQSSQNDQGDKALSFVNEPFASFDALPADGGFSLEAASLWQGSYREFPTEFFG